MNWLIMHSISKNEKRLALMGKIKIQKIDKDSWLIECNGLEKVKVKYNFYANYLTLVVHF